MRNVRWVLLACALVPCLYSQGCKKEKGGVDQAVVPPAGPETDAHMSQGTWIIESFLTDGESEIPTAGAAPWRFIIDKDHFSILDSAGKEAIAGNLEFNPNAAPNHLRLIAAREGTQTPESQLAVYELSHDSFNLCSYARDINTRSLSPNFPPGIQSGKGLTLIKLRRALDAPPKPPVAETSTPQWWLARARAATAVIPNGREFDVRADLYPLMAIYYSRLSLKADAQDSLNLACTLAANNKAHGGYYLQKIGMAQANMGFIADAEATAGKVVGHQDHAEFVSPRDVILYQIYCVQGGGDSARLAAIKHVDQLRGRPDDFIMNGELVCPASLLQCNFVQDRFSQEEIQGIDRAFAYHMAAEGSARADQMGEAVARTRRNGTPNVIGLAAVGKAFARVYGYEDAAKMLELQADPLVKAGFAVGVVDGMLAPKPEASTMPTTSPTH